MSGQPPSVVSILPYHLSDEDLISRQQVDSGQSLRTAEPSPPLISFDNFHLYIPCIAISLITLFLPIVPGDNTFLQILAGYSPIASSAFRIIIVINLIISRKLLMSMSAQ